MLPLEAAREDAIAITDDILESAAQRVALHGLRAYDAVQLATAAAGRSADPDQTLFASFDTTLNAIAILEGFSLLG